MTDFLNRCRIVLTVNTDEIALSDFSDAINGGDIASVILYCTDINSPQYESYCKKAVAAAQPHEIAVITVDSTQAFGRSGADGILVYREKPNLEDFIARFSPQNIVGCGNVKNRHGALQIGEFKPDFLFFGKLSGDIRPEPHHKNLALAEWWSELVQISGIVMGGNDLNSVIECAKTGVEFVGLEKAVFDYADGPKAAVELANAMLDKSAPLLDMEET